MVKQVTTAKKKTTQKVASKPIAVLDTGADARIALLLVSLICNAFIVCLWVALRVTDQYDEALSLFFLGR